MCNVFITDNLHSIMISEIFYFPTIFFVFVYKLNLLFVYNLKESIDCFLQETLH